MFATLSYKDIDNEIQAIPASSIYSSGKSMRHACTECRAKKIKCTGEKSGCSKCSTNGITCVYPPIADRTRKKRKQFSVGRSCCTASTHNDTGTSNKNSSGDDDTSVTSACMSPGDPGSILHRAESHNNLNLELPEVSFHPELLSVFPSKDNEASKGLSQLSSLDFTEVDHDDGTASPYKFNWTGDHSNVLNFKEWEDLQDQYDLTEDLHTPRFTMEQFNLLTPLSSGSLAFPLRPSSSDSSLNRHSRAGPPPDEGETSLDGTQMNNVSKDCTCSQLAMKMLDELESNHLLNEELLVSSVLNHQKQALSNVQKWLNCNDCRTPTAVKTLLGLIIQRLTVYLEKCVAHYFGELSQGNSGLDDKYRGKKVLGEFQVDSCHEWAQVMRVLLKIRAKDLELVLGRLKESALQECRENQLPILASTERQTRRIIAGLTESDSGGS